MKDIYSLELNELTQVVSDLNYQPYRAKQLFLGLHNEYYIDKISCLPKSFINAIKENYNTSVAEIVSSVNSSDGTEKFLVKLTDGNIVECVLMRYNYGNTLCVSTQAGCAMGCAFCASGKSGLIRNLTAGEILSQVLIVNRLYKEGKERFIKNIVLMGSGEPLNNFDNTVKFLKIVSSPEGINISLRNISLSTCGLVPEIYRFADLKIPVTLSLSLHSPYDYVRKEIMPIAQKYTVKESIDAMKYYFQQSGRRVIIEYTMIKNKNIFPKDAAELKKILSGLNCHINLIMLSPIKESPLIPCTVKEAENFRKTLENLGLSATIRRQTGVDIEGACGQLRRKFLENF
jgi:23S rRNA (adenine2503-C2)-methyltransferase